MDRAQNLPRGQAPTLTGLRFRLGDDIDILRQSVQSFAADEIAPRAILETTPS